MTNPGSNRALRMTIPFLFGMMLVVNCASEGSKGGSGCEMPNMSQGGGAPRPKVVGGAIIESQGSGKTKVPGVAVTVTVKTHQSYGTKPRVLNVMTVKTDINGQFRLELSPRAGEVEVRPTKEGYRFDPEVFRGPPSQALNFTASRSGV